jgi:hypothetical protein
MRQMIQRAGRALGDRGKNSSADDADGHRWNGKAKGSETEEESSADEDD